VPLIAAALAALATMALVTQRLDLDYFTTLERFSQLAHISHPSYLGRHRSLPGNFRPATLQQEKV
jgi:hypothetical protein